MFKKIENELIENSNKEKAKVYAGFFKSGKGEYGEGDKFIGTTVPKQREIAQKYIDADFSTIKKLLKSPIHEYRLTGFFILVYKYDECPEQRKEIYNFYLKNLDAANNWDLIDCVSDRIIGAQLFDKKRDLLYKFAKSSKLWDRRIAIISTFYFIKRNDFSDTIKISEILSNDSHDLIQKAVGWMLREVGKRDERVLIKFLDRNYKEMPRTMLRYSIERLSEKQKKHYMLR